MDESQRLVVHALGDPAEHPAPVTIDAVPHNLAYESPYLAEAPNSVELGHTDRHLVAANLGNWFPAAGGNEVGFSRCGAEPRIRLHPLHQQFEVTGRKIKIEIELAEVVKLLERDRLQAGVEGLDYTRAYAANAAVRSPDHPQVRDARAVTLQDRSGIVGGTIVYNDPKSRRDALGRNAVKGAAHVLRLVTTGRDQYVPAVGHSEIAPPGSASVPLWLARRTSIFRPFDKLPEATSGVNRRPTYCEPLDVIDHIGLDSPRLHHLAI